MPTIPRLGFMRRATVVFTSINPVARRAKTKGSRDRTAYGTTRISTGSFLTHHTQRIVKNVVMYDALNIIEQVGCLKQRAHDMA